MHIYFDLISLPLSYINFPHLSFVMQAWVFIPQFRHMQAAGYSKFSNSGFEPMEHDAIAKSKETFFCKNV